MRAVFKAAVAGVGALLVVAVTQVSIADEVTVPVPVIENATIAPKIVYMENPRFPKISQADLLKVMQAAATLVHDHFAITVTIPDVIPTVPIDTAFQKLIGKEPDDFLGLIGDFRNDKVDWTFVKDELVKQINKQKDPLATQIAFARPYLSVPVAHESVDSFAEAVAETLKQRLRYWTTAKLKDGYPVIGNAPGQADLPYNEYLYWSLMAKLGVEADIILTNQLVASVEYFELPVHTSIRGGITAGSTEYNPASRFGTSVWVSLFLQWSKDPQIVKLRNGATFSEDEAARYAGALLAHEMGHQLLHLAHPWSNEACVMRPAEMLDFTAWVTHFDAAKCPLGSSPAMTKGAVPIPIW